MAVVVAVAAVVMVVAVVAVAVVAVVVIVMVMVVVGLLPARLLQSRPLLDRRVMALPLELGVCWKVENPLHRLAIKLLAHCTLNMLNIILCQTLTES